MIVSVLLVACSSSPVTDVADRQVQGNYKGRVHRVVKGETLYAVAFKYGLNYKDLAAVNNIKPPYSIYPGQSIRLDIRALAAANGTPVRGASSARNVTDKRSEKTTKKQKMSSDSAKYLSPPKWQWPSSGKVLALFQGDTGVNKGIDLVGKLGEPVLAAASGQVIYAGSGLSSYGKLLIIKHDETFLSAYAHNNELLVKEGDFVKAGQKIADMGSSGTDRVKLHFEIRSEGNPVDPLKYLPKR